MASLKHRFAKRPSAAQSRPRRRTAKGPETDCTKEGGKMQRGLYEREFDSLIIHISASLRLR
jgi:hypothetical protein